jgi:hypothetical protein
MAQKKNLYHGKGAVCSVLVRFLHPMATLNRLFPNMSGVKWFENMIALAQEILSIKGKDHPCIILQSDEFMDGDSHLEIYAGLLWVRVKQEGPVEKRLNDSNQRPEDPQQYNKQQQQLYIP